ncbi:hypothetical protein EDD18DRAFT_1356690 [Armillaria luteobubalina]|uniref:Ribonuclease H1 N-terminal domain-containing protein n=1 Tax=Armillaria luteobubalina TaxID=153913 RepID=A0AA39Q1W6_9AGAR|nr:hypothetical protein EDD18DRAFT_1356690 [Armillaria luteobubalina]
MTQINIDQVSALLAGTIQHDRHNNSLIESVQGPLHTFNCYNCSFPNVIPTNAIPTLLAVPYWNVPSNASQSECSSSSGAATATQNDGVPPTLASTPDSAVPMAVPQDAPSVPAAGSSVDATTTATTGPDGPWYSIIKGQAVGIFRGWQNVTPLVTGVSRSCYLRHPTQAAAQAAFKEAIMSGSTEVLQ